MQPQKITVQGKEIMIIGAKQADYISLSDIAKKFGTELLVYNWMRNRNTVEFSSIWEKLNNPDFNPIEFDRVKKEAGLNRFTLSPRLLRLLSAA